MKAGAKKGLRLTLAANVRAIRKSLGLSQEQLADAAGLHRTFVGFVERGETNISLDNLEKLAVALGVSASGLIAVSP